jgi:hypothetical protein
MERQGGSRRPATSRRRRVTQLALSIDAYRSLSWLLEILGPEEFQSLFNPGIRDAFEGVANSIPDNEKPTAGEGPGGSIRLIGATLRDPSGRRAARYFYFKKLEHELGSREFQRHTSDSLRSEIASLEGALPDAKQFVEAFHEYRTLMRSLPDGLKKLKAIAIQRAEGGDEAWIRAALELDPLATLGSRTILGHLQQLWEHRNAENAALLRGVAESFRRGLLQPRSGKPRKLRDRWFACRLADAIQAAYDHARSRVHRRYRSRVAWRLDAQEISRTIACEFVESLRKPVGDAVYALLTREAARAVRRAKRATRASEPQHRGFTPHAWREGFGIEAAAIVTGYAPRQIRALLRSGRE